MIFLTHNSVHSFKFFTLLAAFCISSSLGAYVVHSDTLHIALDYLDPKYKPHEQLVILDIDNTLGEPDTLDGLGSDQWFKEMVKSYETQGHNTESAINQVLPSYFAIHHHNLLKPVEPTTASCVKCLQGKAHVMSLTARSPGFSNRTQEQLSAIDIHLHKATVHNMPLNLKHTHPALFCEGILFAGNNNKGDILITFLEKINYIPKIIIFVDDKEHNIRAVEKAAKSKNIAFVGIRHSRLDQKVQNFTLEKTALHHDAFIKKHASTVQYYKTVVGV